jgi:hypothetical protein
MAADTPGSTKVLADSGAEGTFTLSLSPTPHIFDSDLALQALVNSLASAGNSTAETPSREDVSRLSDKLKELLGDSDLPQVTAQRSEVCAHAGMT